MESSSALCARHPAAPAVFTCARCGSFACEACRSPQNPAWCTDCARRHAAPELPVGAMLEESFKLLGNHVPAVGALCGALVVFGLVTLVPNQRLQEAAQTNPMAIFSPTWGIIMLTSTLLSSFLYASFIHYLGQAWAGQTPERDDVLRTGLARTPAMIGANLLLGIILGVGFLFCLVPGVFLSLALCLVMPLVVLESMNPLESLSVSWTRTQGHRGKLFQVLLIAGGLFAIAIGAGMVLGLMFKPLGMLGAVMATVINQGLVGASMALGLALITASYLRLSGRWTPGVR